MGTCGGRGWHCVWISLWSATVAQVVYSTGSWDRLKDCYWVYDLGTNVKDALSDFWPIWPQNFDLKFNRYFDGGRESYKVSFEPLREKVRQFSSEIKCSKLVGITTIYHVTNSYVFDTKHFKFLSLDISLEWVILFEIPFTQKKINFLMFGAKNLT